MKLKRINILFGRKESTCNLEKAVYDYIIRRWEEYDNKSRIFLDILEHGCVSGIVSELIYYSDTIEFYNKYKDDINNLLYELMSESGVYRIKDLLKDFDETDPLICETHNKNLLAWFGFEETLYRLSLKYEVE